MSGVRNVEHEHMVHWGRRSFGVPCGQMVRICALVQCPVRGKLTSSGVKALQNARTWVLKLRDLMDPYYQPATEDCQVSIFYRFLCWR